MKRLILLALLLSAPGCASLPPAKDIAITTLQGSEISLGAAQDAERALCFNHPNAESGPHCTNPVAAQVGLTDARHQAARDFAIAAFSKQKLAATALQLWQPGTAPPQDLVDYQTAIKNLLDIARVLDPGAKTFLDQAQAAVDNAAKAASAVGVK